MAAFAIFKVRLAKGGPKPTAKPRARTQKIKRTINLSCLGIKKNPNE
jgi:hypothetical protein